MIRKGMHVTVSYDNGFKDDIVTNFGTSIVRKEFEAWVSCFNQSADFTRSTIDGQYEVRGMEDEFNAFVAGYARRDAEAVTLLKEALDAFMGMENENNWLFSREQAFSIASEKLREASNKELI